MMSGKSLQDGHIEAKLTLIGIPSLGALKTDGHSGLVSRRLLTLNVENNNEMLWTLL